LKGKTHSKIVENNVNDFARPENKILIKNHGEKSLFLKKDNFIMMVYLNFPARSQKYQQQVIQKKSAITRL